MVNKLIYFATQEEAKATLHRLHAVQAPGTPDRYLFDQGVVIIGGMGVLETMHRVAEEISHVTELWNLGIAGSLHTQYGLGDRVPIAHVHSQAFYPRGLDERSQATHRKLFPPITIRSEGARLVTTDYPIHQASLRDHLALQADLIDMEGYAIAYLAQRAKKACVMWKVVSDFTSEGGPELIRQQLANASEALADIALEGVS